MMKKTLAAVIALLMTLSVFTVMTSDAEPISFPAPTETVPSGGRQAVSAANENEKEYEDKTAGNAQESVSPRRQTAASDEEPDDRPTDGQTGQPCIGEAPVRDAPDADKKEKTNVPAPVTVPGHTVTSGLFSEKSEMMIAFGREYRDCLDDYDASRVYSFAATKRGTFSCLFRYPAFTGTGGWLVSLESEYYVNGTDGETAWRTLCSSMCDCSSTVNKPVSIGVLPGNYRVTVTPYGRLNTDEYTLTVRFEERNDFETECNDTKNRYTELFAGASIHGTSSYYTSGTDTDWYMMRMYNDGVIRLSFSHEYDDKPSVGWRIVMYDEQGNILYSENSAFSVTNTDSGRLGLSRGIYYIAVYGRVYSPGEYVLTAQRVSSALYEKENNDSFDSANDCAAGQTVYGVTSSRQGSADRDYFRFTVERPGIAVLGFTHDELPAKTEDLRGWNVRMYDGAKNLLYYINGTHNVTTVTGIPVGLDAGEYYVCVDCDNCYRVSADYGITLDFTPLENYETEPNDSFETADGLSSAVTLSGNITQGLSDYNDDYFTFEMNGSGKASFTLESSALTADRDHFTFCLYDGQQRPIEAYLADGTPFTGEAKVTAEGDGVFSCAAVLPEGRYYIRITTGDYYTPDIYKLTFTEEIYL